VSRVEDKLRELNLSLPEATPRFGAYAPVTQAGALYFTSGTGPTRGREVVIAGKVDQEVPLERAREAAQIATLNALANLKAALGDLDRITRVVKLNGYVASSPGFHLQPKVLDAASELLVACFGESGRAARSAIGAAELPLNMAVELELTVLVEPSG
jgi:enamine deaminase RidA (YjgF/YER057c/UK114 family)